MTISLDGLLFGLFALWMVAIIVAAAVAPE